MNPIVFAMRRPVTTFMLIATVIGGGFFGLDKMGVITPKKYPKMYAYLEYVNKNAVRIKGKVESYFHKEEAEQKEEPHKVMVTSPKAKDVTVTQSYVCQIHSKQHIEIRAFEGGYLQEILVKEGQAVKKGDLMFKIVPILYQAKLAAENAEVNLAKQRLEYTRQLANTKFDGTGVVSPKEVFLHEAELKQAQAKAELAAAELDFTNVKAPFDGIVDRLQQQLGSLIKEGDILTTLSDNSVMWVYFNVPEKRYLEFMAEGPNLKIPDIELVLASQNKFPHLGQIDTVQKVGAIEGQFNNETGNIPFRADFPNPERILRHGQTGTVLINRLVKDAIVIPQRATFENLAKRYVFVVDKDDVVHQREIEIDYELEDIYVIAKGIDVNDKIVLEGIRQVRDGDKVEYEFVTPEEALKEQKHEAE